MPWKETSAMNERVRFVGDWLSGRYTKSALCRAYGISRPTGDKWIRRYEALGLAGLEERSRAPHTHPNAVSESIRARIVATKLRYQAWGPKKVMDYLRRRYPKEPWPADSTAGELLKRAGLVRPRTPRRRVPPYSAPFDACVQPNDLWSIDFKGDFRLGDGQRCYPLTVSDNFSRFLLHCRALPRTGTAWVQPWLEWVFREYGLPMAMRSPRRIQLGARPRGVGTADAGQPVLRFPAALPGPPSSCGVRRGHHGEAGPSERRDQVARALGVCLGGPGPGTHCPSATGRQAVGAALQLPSLGLPGRTHRQAYARQALAWHLAGGKGVNHVFGLFCKRCPACTKAVFNSLPILPAPGLPAASQVLGRAS